MVNSLLWNMLMGARRLSLDLAAAVELSGRGAGLANWKHSVAIWFHLLLVIYRHSPLDADPTTPTG